MPLTILQINIDIETYSSNDLAECGVYKYVESADFKILLFGYSINNGKANTVDLLHGEPIPDEVIAAVKDDTVIKWAFNASFERICLSKYLGVQLNPCAWRCTMVWSAYLGLPLSLEKVGEALELKEQKLSEGKALIRMFCTPGRKQDLTRWQEFKDYNIRDVEVEMAIQHELYNNPVPDSVWKEYWLDQKINDRGVAVDMTLVNSAIKLAKENRELFIAKMKELTGLENPNSTQQLRGWLNRKGIKVESLDRKSVEKLIKTVTPEVAKVLRLRQQTAKSSIKKYEAMRNAVCTDGRARGMFQFYGANRTGRWAGRLIQLQNLPQNHLDNLDEARQRVLKEEPADSDTLSQLIRTAFVPKAGRKFIVSDFSAIEARILAWLASETWRTEVFESGGDIYSASASQMFKVPVDKKSPLRQKGKIAELALGYGGSVNALINMGALEMGVAENELHLLVNKWRAANPNIVDFWWKVDKAAKEAIKTHVDQEIGNISFSYRSHKLFITLPSGRKLTYIRPHNTSGNITYEGMVGSKWETISTYGPKLVENIVQSIARDILAYAMQSLSRLDIVMHIHDELVIEADRNTSVDEICSIMGTTPSWAAGLNLRADGYDCLYYQKN